MTSGYMTSERGDSAPELEVPEFEPDYRFTLANERTFLAWERTALGLLAAAVAVVQLIPELPIPAFCRGRFADPPSFPWSRAISLCTTCVVHAVE